MDDLLDEIRRLILRLAKAGATSPEIDQAVERLLADNGMEELGTKEAQQQAADAWTDAHTIPASDRQAVRQLLNQSARDYAKVDNRIREGVVRVFNDWSRKDRPLKALESELVSELDGNRHWARTVANTSKAAFQTVRVVSDAVKVGIRRFRYDGPPTRRPFCQLHLGQTYTLAELQSMTNGSGQSALYNRGGYNCRHHLTPIVDDVRADPRDELSKTYFNGAFEDVSVGSQDALDFIENYIGSPEDVARVVGAPDGARVHIGGYYDHLEISVKHPFYVSYNVSIYHGDDGMLEIHNDLIRKSTLAPRRFGLLTFAQQIKHATDHGEFGKITLQAAGSYTNDYWNGYFTWARCGATTEFTNYARATMQSDAEEGAYRYDLKDGDESTQTLTPDACARLLEVRHLHQLMETPELQEYWRRTGRDIDLEFNLERNSPSWKTLAKYLHEKGLQP